MADEPKRVVVILGHPDDARHIKPLVAHLRRLLQDRRCEIWQPNESMDAFGTPFAQLQDAIERAFAVLAVAGPTALDEELRSLGLDMVRQRIVEDGKRFGRIVVRLRGSPELPFALRAWPSARQDDDHAEPSALAQRVVRMLGMAPAGLIGLEAAEALLPSAARARGRSELRSQFRAVAQLLADGKPVTLVVGPYAGADSADDGSCPSRVRAGLLELIREKDPELAHGLEGLDTVVSTAAIEPLLWQDHLATLCVLSGCSRREVAEVIDRITSEAQGDEGGAPTGLFDAIGAFVAQLALANPRASAGAPVDPGRVGPSPAVTILSACPGMRIERGLVAHGCEFERVTLLLGDGNGPAVHRRHYVPDESDALAAREGRERDRFMPDSGEPLSQGQVAFVRLIKPFGSRDLDFGTPSGDLSQSYNVLAQLKRCLQEFVTAARTGPYVVLGGGLGTPPLQAMHSVLLRDALDLPEKRPRLAIAPSHTLSHDRLRSIEIDRLPRLTDLPDSGMNKLDVFDADPELFVRALTIAFGGEPGPTGTQTLSGQAA